MNIAATECYFFGRPFHEVGKPIRGYRKQMYYIWKERQSLKVTDQRLCDQIRMIRMNWWVAKLEMNVIKKSMMNENAYKYDKNIGSDDHDQSQAKEDKCEDLVIFLKNNVTLSFDNIKGMSVEERIMINNIKKHNQNEMVKGFKKVDRNLLKD